MTSVYDSVIIAILKEATAENEMIKEERCIVRFQKCYFNDVTHEVKVVRIGDGWNIRVYTNGQVNQESRVYDRSQIGPAARAMLRIEDKCGNFSKFASAARKRI